MATDQQKFVGWVAHDKDAVNGNMKWEEFNTKTWSEDDVDIEVTHSGICGSDIHSLRSGWGETNYPVVVGHEVVGKAVRVGKNVQDIKVGDRVGVGAQQASCLQPDCDECSSNSENLCQHMKGSYGTKYPDGSMSQGGFALHHRSTGHFAIKIPDAIESADAAPLMCGGVTVYAPLKHHGCGPGKTVGVVGVGGLGHFAVLFAKALGADKVIGISRSNSKKDDVMKMGADKYIATADDEDWAAHNAKSIDLIISTVSGPNMPISDYLKLLKPRGKFVQVGAPEEPIANLSAFSFILGELSIVGSIIGSPNDIREMLQLVVDKKVKPWIQEVPMKDANKAIVDMEAGKARYRYTLVN